MNKSLIAAAAVTFFAVAVHAEDAPSPLTANLSLTTNYKFRGQDQSKTPGNFKPAIQGGVDYTFGGGFYVGNWNSSIGWLNGPAYPDNNSANIEMDFYGGYKGEIVKDVAYDVGILEYAYPGAAFANTTEIYGGVSYSIATLKYSHTVSKKYFGVLDARNTGYLDLAANYEVAKGLTLNGHVGYTSFSSDAKDNGAKNYTDYKVGLTYDLGSGFSVAGAYVGANKKSTYGDINKGRAILTITKSM
ncbi:TorF family putative porin [soil metagenome]